MVVTQLIEKGDWLQNSVIVPPMDLVGKIFRIPGNRLAKAFTPKLSTLLIDKTFNMVFTTGWNKAMEGLLGLGILGVAGYGLGVSPNGSSTKYPIGEDGMDMLMFLGADLTTSLLQANPGEIASFVNDMFYLGRNFARGNFGAVKNLSPVRSKNEIKSKIHLPSFGGKFSNTKTVEVEPIDISDTIFQKPISPEPIQQKTKDTNDLIIY